MVSLAKRTEDAQTGIINLMKKEAAAGVDLGEVSAQVVLVLDVSGSMHGRFMNGEVQALTERTLAMALAGFDDDGTIQVIAFNHALVDQFEVNADNYKTEVSRRLRAHGRTDYLPAINKVVGMLGAELSVDMPTFVLFVTDGETANETAIKQALFNAANKPIFWQFLGLGYRPSFLESLDTMLGRVVDNVGLMDVNRSENMDDVTFHERVLKEYVTSWTPASRAAGVQ